MKRRSAFLSFTACALTAAAPLRAPAATPAKPAITSDLSDIEVVNYASGLTGIFDKSAGKMYLYDSSTKKCVGVRRMTSTGEAREIEFREQVRSQIEFGNEETGKADETAG